MASKMRLQVVSLMRLLFDGDVRSVYLQGDEGEYELLPYHYPLLGALPEGEIKITTFTGDIVYIGLRAGVVLTNENACIIILEELDLEKAIKGASALGDIEIFQFDNTKDKKK